MTTITGAHDVNSNIFDSSQLLGLAAGTLGAHDSTHFVLTADPYTVTVYGTGFTYSGNHPVSGTMTNLTLIQTGFSTLATWSGFSLAATTVWGAIASGNTASFNTLFFGGADTFDMTGSTSVDFLAGYAGNDIFNYLGNFNQSSQIDGGTGTDTLNLDGNYTTYTGLGYVTNIEVLHLAGGHSYNLAYGPSTALTVDASSLGAGNFLSLDSQFATGALNVTGGAGNDTFVSGAGNDTFNGGAGNNTISYDNASGVSVNLTVSGPQAVGGGRGTDTLVSVNNIIGSTGNDTLIGNANDNFFDVSWGADVLNGGGGNDTASFTNNLNGPITVDLRIVSYVSIENIVGSRFGGDIFIGNANDNVFDGNINTFAPTGPVLYDTANYQYAAGGVTFSQMPGSPSIMIATGGGQGTDTLIHTLKLIGSDHDDTFNLNQNYVLASLDARAGSDTVSFQNATGPVNASLGFFLSVEHLTGSNYHDVLFGDGGNNVIDGAGGDDDLYGSWWTGGPPPNGNDTFYGGGGIDSVHFLDPDYSSTITYNSDHSVTVSSTNDGTDILWNIEKLVFSNHTITLPSAKLTAPDFNGDNDADFLWQNTDGTPAIWLMNGTSFVGGSGIGTNPGTAWQIKGSGDFNGDGLGDILWQNADGTPVVWFMDGTTLLGGGVLGFNLGSAWHVISSGDFNGDGYADILWQNTDGTPAISLMNGTTLVSGAALSNPGPAWHVIGAGDFDGNGKSDILWQNDDGTPAVWLMNGTSFVAGSLVGTNPGTSWHVKAAVDFDGDNHDDILWQNTDGTPAAWYMLGLNFSGGFVAGFNPGASWQVVGAGDFNGDGKADIQWQNTDGTPAIWLMNNNIILSGALLPNPGTTWHIVMTAS